VYISGFTLFNDYLVISERSEGLQRLRIRRWSDGKESFVRSDEPAYSARDGTMIPVSLVYRKETALDGTAPLYQ